jgi:hypothetical protein
VRFGGKDNQGAPGALTNADPTVVEENIKMLHNDFAFVRTVVWFAATNGRGAAGVDTKFEIEDGEANAFGIEAVPMRLDNISMIAAQIEGEAEGSMTKFFVNSAESRVGSHKWISVRLLTKGTMGW